MATLEEKLAFCDSASILARGQRIINPQKIRLMCKLWAHCPMAAIKHQDQTFVFSPATFKHIPDDVASNVHLLGNGADGVMIHDRDIFLSNLLFYNDTTDKKEKIIKQSQESAISTTLFDTSTSKAKEPFVPHWAWDLTGSLFDPTVLSEQDYGGKNSSTNLAKFDYKLSQVTINAQATKSNTTATSNAPNDIKDIQPNYCLMPQQVNTAFAAQSAAGKDNGVHFSAVKRHPLFQGTDFIIQITPTALEPNVTTPAKAKPKLQDQFNYLDSSITKKIGGKAQSDGVHVNGGVVDTDSSYQIDESSRSTYDLTSQRYAVIEIGEADGDNHYMILICDKSKPVCLHIGKTPSIVPVSGGNSQQSKTFTIVTPEQDVSRQIGTPYEGASGAQLLSADLIIRVKNQLGQLYITFNNDDNNAWRISRQDLTQAIQDPNSNTDAPDVSDVSSYTYETVPIVVPAKKIAIHCGNMALAWRFSYQLYKDNAVFTIPQSIQIQGTRNHPPTLDDVNLLLRTCESPTTKNPAIPPRGVVTPENDQVYESDAQLYKETLGGQEDEIKVEEIQPNSYKLFGKGHDGKGKIPQDANRSTIQIKAKGDVQNVTGDEERAVYFFATYTLTAGDYTFPENKDGDAMVLPNCISPVALGWRLLIGSEGQSWGPAQIKTIDVSHHVMHFTDSWTAQDWSKIEHTGSIKFLLNEGMNFSRMGLTNYTSQIMDLADRSFYLKVWAWYEPGLSSATTTPSFFPGFNVKDSCIFTGIAQGKVTTTTNGVCMECALTDYSSILQKQCFLNSPFFDSMKDFWAVLEIMRMAGFREDGSWANVTDPGPLALLKSIANTATNVGDWFNQPYQDGSFTQQLTLRTFALPGSYDRLTSRKFRFSDGDSYYDAVSKISQQSGKVIYFDRFGIFHYENRPDERSFYDNSSLASFQSFAKDHFYASPLHPDLHGGFVVAGNGINASNAQYHLAFNSYCWQRFAGDVYNHLIVISASPKGELLLGGDMNFDGIDTPTSTGFLGYQRTLLQMSGLYGSEAAVKDYLQFTTKVYTPPLGITFEVLGRSYLKPLDIITFSGLWPNDEQWGASRMPLRINCISGEIDPKENKWTQKLDCEWIYAGKTINFTDSTTTIST